MFKKYYLAYGSNLNLKQMCHRCPNAKPIGSLTLKDYRLVYKGNADHYAYLTIESWKGSIVPLGVFEVSYLDILSLDAYEGYPSCYTKRYIPITIDNRTKKALIYIMNAQFDYHLPSLKYIQTCLEGYADFDFDRTFLDTALQDTIENHPVLRKKKL